jgi:hypothetical protein
LFFAASSTKMIDRDANTKNGDPKQWGWAMFSKEIQEKWIFCDKGRFSLHRNSIFQVTWSYNVIVGVKNHFLLIPLKEAGEPRKPWRFSGFEKLKKCMRTLIQKRKSLVTWKNWKWVRAPDILRYGNSISFCWCFISSLKMG